MSHIIQVIGLGAGDLEQLPVGIYRRLKSARHPLYLRTKDHPVIKSLEAEGVNYEAFDHYYEQEADFSVVYEKIVDKLIDRAAAESIVYAVPGHPMLAEKTVQLLLDQDKIKVKILGGQSYLDDLFTALKIDPIEGFQFVDAMSFNRQQLNFTNHIIFSQIYDQFIASEVKLSLLEDLPADYEVTIVSAVGTVSEKLSVIPLENLDRGFITDNLTSVYIPPVPKDKLNHTFNRLREIIAYLRGPEGCAWDRKQTHESLRPYVLEEAYELLEAIAQKDIDGIVEELGDLLLQVMLHSQIGEDSMYFSIDDVILTLTNKMIHRHPHVFNNEANKHKTWDELKAEENGQAKASSLLSNIPREMPALLRAEKIQQKAAKVGFDWAEVADVWEKLSEELAEVKEAIEEDDEPGILEEFGDLLFVVVNLMRFYGVNAEIALELCNKKFTKRFQFIEQKVADQNQSMKDISLEVLDSFWEQAKERE